MLCQLERHLLHYQGSVMILKFFRLLVSARLFHTFIKHSFTSSAVCCYVVIAAELSTTEHEDELANKPDHETVNQQLKGPARRAKVDRVACS